MVVYLCVHWWRCGGSFSSDSITEWVGLGCECALMVLFSPSPFLLCSLFDSYFLPPPLLPLPLLPSPPPSCSGLSSSAQRRDALRLLCLLLPQPNRDTLLELLQFLSRVALHSDGIILIDGTEVIMMEKKELAQPPSGPHSPSPSLVVLHSPSLSLVALPSL